MCTHKIGNRILLVVLTQFQIIIWKTPSSGGSAGRGGGGEVTSSRPNILPQNPPIDVSELHTVCGSSAFEALELQKCMVGLLGCSSSSQSFFVYGDVTVYNMLVTVTLA